MTRSSLTGVPWGERFTPIVFVLELGTGEERHEFTDWGGCQPSLPSRSRPTLA